VWRILGLVLSPIALGLNGQILGALNLLLTFYSYNDLSKTLFIQLASFILYGSQC
jgi:hypothetical protein